MNIIFYLHDERDSNALENRLLWLSKRYHFISSDEVRAFYYEGKKLKNSCHITIDDGWLSTYRVIFPLLKKYNIPASIFVSPRMCIENKNFWYIEYKGYDEFLLKKLLVDRKFFRKGVEKFPLDLIFKEMQIDDVRSIIEEYRILHNMPLKERGIVNVKELREMDHSGLIEIGAHTMLHPILSREEDKRSEKEIKDSILGLSEILNRKVITFAYPNGLQNLDFGSREVAVVKSCGIELAYSVNPGCINSKNDPLAIPRVCSFARLYLGKIGLCLPSLHNQENMRKDIKKYRI